MPTKDTVPYPESEVDTTSLALSKYSVLWYRADTQVATIPYRKMSTLWGFDRQLGFLTMTRGSFYKNFVLFLFIDSDLLRQYTELPPLFYAYLFCCIRYFHQHSRRSRPPYRPDCLAPPPSTGPDFQFDCGIRATMVDCLIKCRAGLLVSCFLLLNDYKCQLEMTDSS